MIPEPSQERMNPQRKSVNPYDSSSKKYSSNGNLPISTPKIWYSTEYQFVSNINVYFSSSKKIGKTELY